MFFYSIFFFFTFLYSFINFNSDLNKGFGTTIGDFEHVFFPTKSHLPNIKGTINTID